MRRLSIKKRGRSASIAVPGTSSAADPEDRCSEDEEERSGSPLLTRTRSERRYQSTGNMRAWTASDLEDVSADCWQSYYLRCFSVTTKGVVSRGDYLRYRRVRNPSLAECPTELAVETVDKDTLSVPEVCCNSTASAASSANLTFLGIEEFTVYLVGSPGVGKTALTQQFTTSEHILNSKSADSSDEEAVVTVSLDGEESRLVFKEITSVSSIEPFSEDSKPCAFLVVYSVTQMESFLAATYILCELHQSKYDEEAVLILVGNKSDLVRSRSVDLEEGMTLASSYKIKFIETSVGINYNVDELLVGVVTHLRALMKRRSQMSSQSSKWGRFSGARSSIRRMFRRVMKKDEPRNMNCDIFKAS